MQPDPTSPLDLDALKALSDAATPGPWTALTQYPHLVMQKADEYYVVSTNLAGKPEADAAFIAAAREAVPAILADLAEAQRERDRLRGDRIVSVVFGHHKGAPRPFAVRVPGEREPRYLGAQWPDGFVVLQGPNGGAMPWRSAEDMLADFDGVEIVWLSDELESLADMEQQRDAARADAEGMRPVRDALRGWYRVAPTTSAADSALMAAWEEHCQATGECYTCDRPRCPECDLCPLCAGDGHDEGCSREGDEYETQTGGTE